MTLFSAGATRRRSKRTHDTIRRRFVRHRGSRPPARGVGASHARDDVRDARPAGGSRLFFKCENFQKSGSFKFRGACNAVRKLAPEGAARGVVTHSSGNHAQALALAAKMRGIVAHVVMPRNASPVKRRAVEEYGGRVIECEPTTAAREATAAAVLAETGGTLIPPYNHADVIAGQGTAALELLEQAPGTGRRGRAGRRRRPARGDRPRGQGTAFRDPNFRRRAGGRRRRGAVQGRRTAAPADRPPDDRRRTC